MMETLQNGASQTSEDNIRYRHSRKKIAKLYNNAIRRPLVNIELDHVAPPYLHILLGITKKHHDLLEDECHSLDKLIGQSLASSGKETAESSAAFHKSVVKSKDVLDQEEKKRKLETELVFAEPNSDDEEPLANFQQLRSDLEERIAEKEDQIEVLKSELDLPPRSGPVTSHLDIVLNEHKICKQAYHGKSFIGNHCHAYMKEETITHIGESIINKTADLTQEHHLRLRASTISEKFTTLNTLYSAFHANISHTRPVTEDDINTLDRDIAHYMSFYRTEFHRVRITPKQHLLEHHCVPFMRQHGFGLGLHGEQGGEEVHAVVNCLKRRAWGMKSEEEKMSVIMTEHMCMVSLTLQGVAETMPTTRKKAAD